MPPDIVRQDLGPVLGGWLAKVVGGPVLPVAVEEDGARLVGEAARSVIVSSGSGVLMTSP
ncbi:MAG: hypothetical protein ABSB01_23065 [Streptosporangiaceae bacterium]